jgi:hypothetical protein
MAQVSFAGHGDLGVSMRGFQITQDHFLRRSEDIPRNIIQTIGQRRGGHGQMPGNDVKLQAFGREADLVGKFERRIHIAARLDAVPAVAGRLRKHLVEGLVQLEAFRGGGKDDLRSLAGPIDGRLGGQGAWSTLAGQVGDFQTRGSQMQLCGQSGHGGFGAVGLDFSVPQRAVKRVSDIPRAAGWKNPAVHVENSR